MENNTDIEFHINNIEQSVSKLTEILSIVQVISHNIIGGYTYITSNTQFKVDISKKDKKFIISQYIKLQQYFNTYNQIINNIVDDLQKNQLYSLILSKKLTTQIKQFIDTNDGFTDDSDISYLDLLSSSNQTVDLKQYEKDSKEDLTQLTNITEISEKNNFGVDSINDDIIITNNKKNNPGKSTDTSVSSSTKKKKTLLEEHPDEIVKFINIHNGPQITDFAIKNDELVCEGLRSNYFIEHVLNQIKINVKFSAIDIYHLLCANLLPNYVNAIHLYNKYSQDYEPHLVDEKDQIIIKYGFKEIMKRYLTNEKIFDQHKFDQITSEWNDTFHELIIEN